VARPAPAAAIWAQRAWRGRDRRPGGAPGPDGEILSIRQAVVELSCAASNGDPRETATGGGVLCSGVLDGQGR